MKHFLSLLVVCVLFLQACTDRAPSGGGDILAIGDSVMAWNGRAGQAIPDQLEQQLGRDVISRAVPGAQIDNGSALATVAGFDIQRQYPGKRWNWIVVNGGANDVGFDDCGCGDCRHVVDRLIAADGVSGTIPAFVTRLQSSGAQVLWMGYYNSPGGGSFSGCRDDLELMEARIKKLVATSADLHFVDGETVISETDLTHFASDKTHPSVLGSGLLAGLLAQTIRGANPRSQRGR